MLGRVMEVHLAQQRGGRPLAQHVLEALSEVDVQVVQHEVHFARSRIRVGQKRLDEDNEVDLATLSRHRDDAPPGFGLDGHEQIGGAFANVFVVPAWPAHRAPWQWLPGVSKELQALLVDTDDRFVVAQRLGLKREQVVHAAPVLFGQRADAPHQPAPGFEIFFLTCAARSPGSPWPGPIPCAPRVRRASNAAGPRVALSRQAP